MTTDAEIEKKETLFLQKNQVSRFHTRQSLSILLGFLILVAVLIVMTAQNYIIAQKHEEAILVRQFREKIIYMDHLLSSVTENVEGMLTVANADLLQSRHAKTLNQPMEFRDLKYVSSEKRYNLDNFHSPIKKEMIGNLTGLGSLEDKDDDFYRELHMALTLNPQFQAISKSLKNAAWVYYTSKNNFINIYPWVSSNDFSFSNELLSHEFYKLGIPENNTNRTRFWTQVYVDEYGKGLMTTCAAPIYDNDRFLGTVAIDLTVDFLNTIVKEFNMNNGVMCLINDRGQLLAHPKAITSKDKRTKRLDETLPDELKSAVKRLTRLPDKKVIQLDSFKVLIGHLDQAPWQVFYYEQTKPFAASLIDLIGIGPPAVLSMLLILVVMFFVVTEKQFILPSKNFVNYIINRSQKVDTPKESRIPTVWKSWFDIIDTVFSENETLTQEILLQNEHLEHRVKQRTAELEKEIEERKTAEAENKELIIELKSALAEVKTLQGLIPICSFCKKIRDDKGYWNILESYIQKYSNAQFSHGMCPECFEKFYDKEAQGSQDETMN